MKKRFIFISLCVIMTLCFSLQTLVFAQDNKLNIAFDPEDLSEVYKSNKKIVVIRHTNKGEKVAWLVFNPFKNNVVTFDDQVTLYESNSKTEPGSIIKPLISTPANSEKKYIFKNDSFTDENDSGIHERSYYVKNMMSESESNKLTFGLGAFATINGKRTRFLPINAEEISQGGAEEFSAYDTLTVYMEDNVQQSSVIVNTEVNAIKVSFDESNKEITIKYNSITGGFYFAE